MEPNSKNIEGKKYISKDHLVIILALIIVAMILIMGLSLRQFLNKNSLSFDFFINNKIMVLKYKRPDYNFPNYLAIDKKEEEKKFRFPATMPKPPRELHIPILMYHHIAYYPPTASQLQRGLTISPADFEQQLSYLKQAGYQTVLLADLFKALYYGQKLPLKPVILTFDDGYDNAYYNAFPILKKYKEKGSFYLISDLIGQPGRLTCPQAKEMLQAGMEFGSHSKTHPDFRRLLPETISFESLSSKITIEKALGDKIYFFCYPVGGYKPEDFSILKNQGYLLALTATNGATENSDHPFELPRLRIWGGISLDDFRNLLP
jgi:peptidoglycan/xylan/chitin deacetylase (PgdA/CDA1 family)